MKNPIVREKDAPFGSLGTRVPLYSSDPNGVFHFYSGAYRPPEIVRQGIVVCYNPQTHSAAVRALGKSAVWSCVFADELLSYSFGFSETHPPREGEFVLFVETAPNSQSGIIIGRIPYIWNFAVTGDKYNDAYKYHRVLYTQDDANLETWDKNVPSYMTPFKNKFDDSTHINTHFRPTDVYPGEFAHVNQHNCGMKGGLFSVTLLGGGANLRMSALTNTARLSCENYKRFSMLGNMHEFHNGRYLSAERDVAMYQEERLGGAQQEDEVWDEEAEAPKKGENQTMRPRMKEMSGYFGHISSKFCLRPDPNDQDIRVLGEGEPKEAGVSRETIDPSGQYRMSAAGMITIERTGRIPVPVRTCYPTDKDHDIKSQPQALTPFVHSENDPCYRQLELFDRQAYDLKTQYARVDNLGAGGEPDYYTPQEEDLDPLDDIYDDEFTGSETVKLKKFDKRRAGMYIGEDGSVIIRDAWGSEIVMLGGNVSISCAGNVMMLPGKTQLTIAGDDIVQKAQNSVDIHASEHDVRLSAARNMEILGGGDESQYSGGVIIESRGKSGQPWDGKDKGESARVSGITLKTKNQGVVVDGEKVVIRSKTNTRILSGDKNLKGAVNIGAKRFLVRAESSVISTGEAAVSVNKGGANLVGSSVVVGGSSLYLDKGGKTPGMWVDASGVAKGIADQLGEMTQYLEDDKQASLQFDREALEKMVFGFRTSQECGTDKSWVIGTSDGFKMYEPAWVQVMKTYETLKNGGVDAKEYEEKAEWENGKPFPGEDAESSAKYAQLSGLSPKNLTSDGFNVSRDEVSSESNIEEVPLKEGYLIRR